MNRLFGIPFITLALFAAVAAVSAPRLFADPQASEQARERQAPSRERGIGPPGRSTEEQHRDRDALLWEERALLRKMEDLEEQLAAQENPELAESLRGDLADIERNIAQIWRKIDQIDHAMREEMEFPEPLRRQREELHVAAENLRAVGMDREADQLIGEAEALVAERRRKMRFDDERRNGQMRIDRLEREVAHLQHQIEQLRAEMDELYDVLDSALGLDDSLEAPDRSAEERDTSSSER